MPLTVIATKDFDHLSELAAEIVVKDIRRVLAEKKEYALGLATGASPTGLYKHLAKAANGGKFDARRIRSYNLDEYIGLPGGNPQERLMNPESYSFFMVQELFGLLHPKFREMNVPAGSLINQSDFIKELKAFPNDWREVGADAGRAILIKRDAESEYLRLIRQECLDGYVKKIKKAGGIDLHVIGVGGRGHVAFHEAGIPFKNNKMLLVRLDQNTIDNAIADGHFASATDCPRYALSMGAELVFQARRLVLLAYGPRKVKPILATLLEPPSADLPISYARVYADHGGDMTIVVDRVIGDALAPYKKELKARGVTFIDKSTGQAKTKLTGLHFYRHPDRGVLC